MTAEQSALVLTVLPITLANANRYVSMWHRHHRPARGCVFCLSVVAEDQFVHGVAIVGRPVARMLQDGTTCEVLRVATDGTPNACSCLYGAARRAARALGYRRIITYTLAEEPGTSLRAAGWHRLRDAGGGSWSRESRPRHDYAPMGVKQLWVAP